MSRSFDFHETDRFTAGAVGEPGARTFFIQADRSGERCTLLAEKEQVAILAQALLQLIDNLEEGPEGVEPRPEELDLVEPLDAEWRAGEMAIQYLDDSDRIAIVITEARPDDEQEVEDDDVPESARFIVTRSQARAMAGHALDIVSSGRPRCQFCGNPIDGDGHVCPAMNGHRPARSEE